jgi:hypothetical protein
MLHHRRHWQAAHAVLELVGYTDYVLIGTPHETWDKSPEIKFLPRGEALSRLPAAVPESIRDAFSHAGGDRGREVPPGTQGRHRRAQREGGDPMMWSVGLERVTRTTHTASVNMEADSEDNAIAMVSQLVREGRLGELRWDYNDEASEIRVLPGAGLADDDEED